MGVSILAFIGVLVDHIVGSLIFQSLTPLDPTVWEAVAFVYPIERLLVTVVAAILGAGIIRGVRTSGLKLGETIA